MFLLLAGRNYIILNRSFYFNSSVNLSRTTRLSRGFLAQFRKQNCAIQKTALPPIGDTAVLVEATGFEPTTFASRTQRATNCATPRLFLIFLSQNANIITNTKSKVNLFYSQIKTILYFSVFPSYLFKACSMLFHKPRKIFRGLCSFVTFLIFWACEFC